MNKPQQRFCRKDVAQRLGVDVRTIDRYKADGTLPKPKRQHGRPYWTERQLKLAEAISMKRWEADRRKCEAAAKLRQKRLDAAASANVRQINLPIQLTLPVKI